MESRDLVKNIKVLVIFFTVCFISIIAYLTYFNIYVADKIINDTSNRRIKAAENEILRGSILDRNGRTIAYSRRKPDGSQVRLYNDDKQFAHVVGYFSYIYGKTGVELGYNSYLQGKQSGYNILGSIFKTIKETVNGDEKKGNDVFLTIDMDLQERAYKALGNNKGAVAAIDPATGEVLALVSKPSFNLEDIDKDFKKYNSDTEGTPLINRATRGYYPPGSTFKIITAASALENLQGIESRVFNCNGKLKIGNYILKDHEGTSHGKLNMEKAFRVSCNFTFGSIGMELGFGNLKNTAEDFMFNKEIYSNDDVELLNIKEGTIKTDSTESKAVSAQDAIGQNLVTANPMQMALVTGAVANHGVMMKPYVVKQIKDRYGMVIENKKPEDITRAISENVADKLKLYMIEVVKKGTGTRANINGITVAGKTGTAEDGKKTHSWFTCFAPADNPKIAVAVIVENGGVGGGKAAGVARDVIKEYLKK